MSTTNFKTSACLFIFYQWDFFAYSRLPHILRFRFKSTEVGGNFVVRSLEVGMEAIAIRIMSFMGSLFKSLVAGWQIVGTSGDLATLTQQPCKYSLITLAHMYSTLKVLEVYEPCEKRALHVGGIPP